LNIPEICCILDDDEALPEEPPVVFSLANTSTEKIDA